MSKKKKISCRICRSTAEFNHGYLNSGCKTKKEFCIQFCKWGKERKENKLLGGE